MAEKKNQMTPAVLEEEIKKGNLSGAYVFFGNEDFLKRYTVAEMEKALLTVPGMEVFNLSRVSFSSVSMTKDEAFSALASSLASLPMMQEKRLTEVQDLAIDGLPAASLTLLCDNLAMADEQNIVVLVCRKNEWEYDYKTENSAEYKKLSAVATVVRFDPLPKARLKTWAGKKLAKDKVQTEEGCLDLLCDMCGCEMSVIAEETAKLSFYARYEGKNFLTVSDVRSVVCPAVPSEAPPFAMLEAAQNWSISAMVDVVSTARDLREEPIALVAKLGKIYSEMIRVKAGLEAGKPIASIAAEMKIKEYSAGKYAKAVGPVPMAKLEECVRFTYETDLAMKSSTTDPWVLLDMLVSRLYVPKVLL